MPPAPILLESELANSASDQRELLSAMLTEILGLPLLITPLICFPELFILCN